MRDDKMIERMADALETRLDEKPFPLIGMAVQAKAQTLRAIASGESTAAEIDQRCQEALLDEMDLPSFIHVQAARNAVAWARSERDEL
jgi:hypothetical protein